MKTALRRLFGIHNFLLRDCQKIELYGSPTTKDLKKKHSFIWVRGAERTQHGVARQWQVAAVVVASGMESPTFTCSG